MRILIHILNDIERIDTSICVACALQAISKIAYLSQRKGLVAEL